jgi:type VI secretion system protein VasG
MVDAILTQSLLPRLATHFLEHAGDEQGVAGIVLDAADDDFVITFHSAAAAA